MTDVLQLHLATALEHESKRYLQEVEEKAQHYEDSIRYAERIQQAILPNIQLFLNNFLDAMVYFQPKDIVSGDFYWMHKNEGAVYFAVGDCTGHGVPGAMLTMAGNTVLRQIINNRGVEEPVDIIKALDKELVGLLNDNLTIGHARDGMDLVFCKYDLHEKKLTFCAAGRPLILVRKGVLYEFESGPDAVGFSEKTEKQFHQEVLQLKAGDQLYLFTDGYTDQFGGENVKKFNRKRLRSLLESITDFHMTRQQQELETVFNEWKGKHQQIDDVCVLGVRI
jgi:serine phosphatase RsbU (regulator of sigma subunit)